MHFDNQLPSELIITTQKASHLFRASQEIINNIVKHAGADEINIKLNAIENATLIQFEHDGLGVSDKDVEDLIKQDKGLGLTSIRSRLSIIEAKITYDAPLNSNPQIIITYFNDETKD